MKVYLKFVFKESNEEIVNLPKIHSNVDFIFQKEPIYLFKSTYCHLEYYSFYFVLKSWDKIKKKVLSGLKQIITFLSFYVRFCENTLLNGRHGSKQSFTCLYLCFDCSKIIIFLLHIFENLYYS